MLGDLDPDTTLSGRAVLLHGELMAGRWGDYVIEVAACWAIVMAVTGYYLFFRGRAARVRRKAAGAKAAALRYRHGVVGSLVGIGLLFLLVSGLPWTGFWGAKAQQLATSNGSSFWARGPRRPVEPAVHAGRVAPALACRAVGPGRHRRTAVEIDQTATASGRSPTSTPRSSSRRGKAWRTR